jgi:hypothetical protein
VRSPRSLSTRGRYLVAAAACLAVTWLPLLIGVGLHLFPFAFWGVLSGYLGLSWLLPGVFVGFAAVSWAKDHNREHPKAVGAAVGVAAGAVAIIGFSVLLAALGGGKRDEDTAKGPVKPAVTVRNGRIAVVSAAAQQTKHAPVDFVMCDAGSDSTCVVTYAGPACQTWIVENVDGVDKARAIDDPADGCRGTYDEGRDSIGYWFDLP